MSKSQIVSYTSEELKQRQSQSDWAAADAMTEDEINAAIASDPEEAALGDEWLERGKITVRVGGKNVPARPRTGSPSVRLARVGSSTSGTVDVYLSFSNSEWQAYTDNAHYHTQKTTTGELTYR
jgi:hypothetical protein